MQTFTEIIEACGQTLIGALANVTATYRKNGDDQGANDRTISAHCQYINEKLDGQTRSKHPIAHLSVLNDGADGIASDEVDTGGDKILLAPRPGEMARWFRIVRIVNQNAGWLTLELT